MRIYIFFLALVCLCGITATAQTNHQNSGWLFLMNNNKLSKKWGTHFDLQLRSSDDWSKLRNVLIRPGFTYFIDNRNDLTLGYLFTQTYAPSVSTLTEHRIWQQYIHKHKIGKINVNHRFRLEQRFIDKQSAEDVFAQRARYFVRFLLPLQTEANGFEKGFFVAL